MTNLVLLATVFITLNGFAHSCPSRTLNQPTNRLVPAAFTLPKRTDNHKGQGPPLKTERVGREVVVVYDTVGENDDEPIGESESIKNQKKNTWKSKIDQLNKWRLPRMENKNLPTVFILRTNEYEK